MTSMVGLGPQKEDLYGTEDVARVGRALKGCWLRVIRSWIVKMVQFFPGTELILWHVGGRS